MTDRHPLATLEILALVAVGGFAGSNLRYLADQFAPGIEGTLLVNVLGSFALGFLLYEAARSDLLASRTRLVLGSGFLSSFTTYSTFVVEAVQSTPLVAVGYVVASYVLGFGAVLVGRHLAIRVESGVEQWTTTFGEVDDS